MTGVIGGAWLIATIELKQRVRGVAWYVLLGVFMFVILCATVLLVLATNALHSGGGGVFSTIIFFVLLLATLVSPALSGNAINGERDAGTLATTQVTLVSTAQIVIGKWLAAWITALAFLVGALPFLIFAVALGQVSLGTIAVSTLVLAAELAVIAAFGVGLSGVLSRPLFSIVVTYLVIAALSVGTLITFGLLGAATQSDMTYTYKSGVGTDGGGDCSAVNVSHSRVPRFDHYWGILAANPYVILADAAPPSFNDRGQPQDLFTAIAVGVRQVQKAPPLETTYDDCAPLAHQQTPEESYESAVPSWFVGLTIQLVLAAGALFWAWRRTDTPARRLATGVRVA